MIPNSRPCGKVPPARDGKLKKSFRYLDLDQGFSGRINAHYVHCGTGLVRPAREALVEAKGSKFPAAGEVINLKGEIITRTEFQ
jgi:hypothetical protein